MLIAIVWILQGCCNSNIFHMSVNHSNQISLIQTTRPIQESTQTRYKKREQNRERQNKLQAVIRHLQLMQLSHQDISPTTRKPFRSKIK